MGMKAIEMNANVDEAHPTPRFLYIAVAKRAANESVKDPK